MKNTMEEIEKVKKIEEIEEIDKEILRKLMREVK